MGEVGEVGEAMEMFCCAYHSVLTLLGKGFSLFSLSFVLLSTWVNVAKDGAFQIREKLLGGLHVQWGNLDLLWNREFLVVLALWAVLYTLVSFAVRLWTGSHAGRRDVPEKFRQDLRDGTASYIMSMVNSIFLVCRGLYHLYVFHAAPSVAQVQPPLDPLLPYHAETMEVVASNRVFSAYLLVDLFLVIMF